MFSGKEIYLGDGLSIYAVTYRSASGEQSHSHYLRAVDDVTVLLFRLEPGVLEQIIQTLGNVTITAGCDFPLGGVDEGQTASFTVEPSVGRYSHNMTLRYVTTKRKGHIGSSILKSEVDSVILSLHGLLQGKNDASLILLEKIIIEGGMSIVSYGVVGKSGQSIPTDHHLRFWHIDQYSRDQKQKPIICPFYDPNVLGFVNALTSVDDMTVVPMSDTGPSASIQATLKIEKVNDKHVLTLDFATADTIGNHQIIVPSDLMPMFAIRARQALFQILIDPE